MDVIHKGKEIRDRVKLELEHIPRGLRGSSQNELRMVYWMRRQHSLGRKGNKESKEATLLKSIETVKKYNPDFKPKFDKDFFKLKSKH